MIVDILIGVCIVVFMAVMLIMAIMYEAAMGEILRREATLKQNAARRQKWKRIKNINRRGQRITPRIMIN